MKKLGLGLALACMVVAPAMAQMMPSPRTAPHTSVNRETLMERRAAPPHDVEGQALILDGEKLRIEGVDLRLFGVVPPQLSASFGPQARAALDGLIGGGQTIACHVRDRDHDGRLLATCRSASGADPAFELLRRGLAVAARGSIAETELAAPYVNAEIAAQNEKLGLWSLAVATPAPTAQQLPVIIEAPKTAANAPVETQAKTASAVMEPTKAPVIETPKSDVTSPKDSQGLFARYQILIAGALMLATALSILLAVTIYRAKEKRDEMKALAAALWGELMAARAVCLTRIKNIMSEEDDLATSWPRIRSTLYQAYVGKIGFLGAELARQVASIYGQASDYASYYNNLNDATASTAMPKRQALQMLASHIDQVLPRLASMEQTGHRAATPASSMAMPMTPIVPPAKMQPQAPVMAIASSASDQKKTEDVAVVESRQNVENRLRDVVRHLMGRFTETRASSEPSEEMINDYTSMIERDAERFSFGSSDEDETPPISRTSRS